MKRIGIIGGLGPAATAHMHTRLVELAQELYGAVEDWEFPPIDIMSVKSSMDVSGSYKSEMAYDIEGILDEFCDHIVLSSCNTITWLLRIMNANIAEEDPGAEYRFIDMPKLARDEAERWGYHEVSVLCSEMSQKLQLFESAKYATKYPDQVHVDRIISDGMGGTGPEPNLDGIYAEVWQTARTSPMATIVGCTEISKKLFDISRWLYGGSMEIVWDLGFIDSLELGCREALGRVYDED